MPAPFYTLPFRPGRSAATAVETALGQVLATKPVSQTFGISSMRGCRVQVYSNGADNETATATVYALDQIGSGENGTPGFANGGYFAISLGTLAITLGTKVGTADSFIGTNMRFADTMTWSPTTYGTARLAYCGGNIAAFSPANDTVAELLMSDIGGSSDIAFVWTTYGLTTASSIWPLISAIV